MTTDRVPKTPGEGVTIQASSIHEAARQKFPEINRWWVTTHLSVGTLLKVPKPIPQDCKCEHQNSDGKFCELPAEFEHLTVFVLSNSKGAGKIATIRKVRICSACLYTSSSAALSGMMDPEFYQSAETNDGDDDPDSMYLFAERMDYLQTNMPEIVKTLGTEKPEILHQINMQVTEFDHKEQKHNK